MEAVIREATAEDAAALGRVHHASWREAYADLLPPAFWAVRTEERQIALWAERLAAPEPGRSVRVAVRHGLVIGFAEAGSARTGPGGGPIRDRELRLAYVLRSEYGTGVAARLLQAVLPPGTPAEVWVFEANRRARAFYAKHGFTTDGGRRVRDAELGHQPQIRMVR